MAALVGPATPMPFAAPTSGRGCTFVLPSSARAAAAVGPGTTSRPSQGCGTLAKGPTPAWGLGSTAAAATTTAAWAAFHRARLARRRGTSLCVGRRDAAFAAAAVPAATGLSAAEAANYPVLGSPDIMAPKAHGTSPHEVQKDLRWSVDHGTADRICSFNRDFAEFAGYWRQTRFIDELRELKQKDPSGNLEVTFFDSVTGKPLFKAPQGRTVKAFLEESNVHGWPSFRDQEVVWENVRCLKNGECISVDGTHLGHNLPDNSGNRYCINLVSVAGRPA